MCSKSMVNGSCNVARSRSFRPSRERETISINTRGTLLKYLPLVEPLTKAIVIIIIIIIVIIIVIVISTITSIISKSFNVAFNVPK